MITDELAEIIVEKTNLYFQQNIVGKIFKKSSHITRYLEESKHARLFSQNDIFLYIATLVYRGVVHQRIYHMYYTNDKIFETLGFRKIIYQNKLAHIEKYIQFVDISGLGESYNRSSQNSPNTRKYIVEHGQLL